MLTETLSANDVEVALKKALPGFENCILVEERTRMIIVEARGPVWLYGKMNVDPYRFPLPTNEFNEAFGEEVRRMVRATRAHAIKQLGLDEEIKQQVEETTAKAVAAAKQHWEQEGWRKGYAAASRDLVSTIRDALTPRPSPGDFTEGGLDE